MALNIYLAARYIRRMELVKYGIELQAAGHIVTSRWLLGEHEIPEGVDGDTHPNYARLFASEDFDDIKKADCLIAFTEPGPVENGSRGGRHVELGMALALQKLTVVVGYRENVFCSLPQVVYMPSWEACKDWLSEVHAVAGLS